MAFFVFFVVVLIISLMLVLLTRKLHWYYSRYISWAFIPTLAISALAVINTSSHPAYGGL